MSTHPLFHLESGWAKVLEEELQKPYIAELNTFIEGEKKKGITIFPPQDLVFNAFWKTPYNEIRVVIVGQDPYHRQGQAHGLAFSVPYGIPQPPSLQNIFKELESDLGIPKPNHGCLEQWAEQGVLLLNSTLTVEKGKPLSHHGHGWEKFTDAVLSKLCEKETPVVFVLWGRSAQDKCRFLQPSLGEKKHFVLTAAHPSPFSARQGFFGCRHFSKTNEILAKYRQPIINWKIS
jgi:uracil-DNA glycosylase